MLVLTRKLMERLFIGDDICVTVVRLEGGQVRLGIDAPRDVAVVRAELVPERAQAYRDAHHGPAVPPAPKPANTSTAAAAAPPRAASDGITIPQASARGTDSPRRGRSQ